MNVFLNNLQSFFVVENLTQLQWNLYFWV